MRNARAYVVPALSSKGKVAKLARFSRTVAPPRALPQGKAKRVARVVVLKGGATSEGLAAFQTGSRKSLKDQTRDDRIKVPEQRPRSGREKEDS